MNAVRDIVIDVVREALRERGLRSLTLLRPGSAGHDLMIEWLGDDFVIEVAERAPADRRSIVLDPAPKDVLLLDGPLPGADVLPLGDVWSTRVRSRDRDAPLSPLEAALAEVFDGGRGLGAMAKHLGEAEAGAVQARILATSPMLRPPIVPKLTEWTIGIDPGP